MKVRIKISGTAPGGSLFGSTGGNQTVEASISLDEHMNADTGALTDLLGALTVSANAIVATIIGPDESEPQPDDEPEEEAPEGKRSPGDAVRLWFQDSSSRIYIDTGTGYYSPAVDGVFHRDSTLSYGDPSINAASVVAVLGETLGEPANGR